MTTAKRVYISMLTAPSAPHAASKLRGVHIGMAGAQGGARERALHAAGGPNRKVEMLRSLALSSVLVKTGCEERPSSRTLCPA